LNYYVLFQYVLCLIGTSLFLFNQGKFSLGEKAIFTVIISLVVVNCGVLFEHKRWVVISEWVRIIAYPAILMTLTVINGWSWLYIAGSAAYLLTSPSCFYFLTHKTHARASASARHADCDFLWRRIAR